MSLDPDARKKCTSVLCRAGESSMAMTLTVNGEARELEVPAEMPLLWALRETLGLTGTKFGCGISACGACTVHLDGQAIRSCITPISAATDRKVTTIEAMSAPVDNKRMTNSREPCAAIK
jgi:aerobic-type carbon monoxide dehydrogenase small subunit (CoxS/CutS family)